MKTEKIHGEVGKTGLKMEHQQVAKRETKSGVQKGKRSLLACQTICKCSMKTTRYSVKVKLGIKVMKRRKG